MKTITISEGKTNALVLPAILILLIGIPFCIFLPLVGILILLFGVSLFMATTGLEIASSGKSYRKYTDYFGMRSGAWVTIDSVVIIELKLSVESTTIQDINSRSTLKSVTYDLFLQDEFGKEQMIYEFLAYKPAKEALNAFADIKQIEAIDHIATKIHENRMKRGNR
jgi:hypothetical protein